MISRLAKSETNNSAATIPVTGVLPRIWHISDFAEHTKEYFGTLQVQLRNQKCFSFVYVKQPHFLSLHDYRDSTGCEGEDVSHGGDSDGHPGASHRQTNALWNRLLLFLLTQVLQSLHNDEHVVNANACQNTKRN